MQYWSKCGWDRKRYFWERRKILLLSYGWLCFILFFLYLLKHCNYNVPIFQNVPSKNFVCCYVSKYIIFQNRIIVVNCLFYGIDKFYLPVKMYGWNTLESQKGINKIFYTSKSIIFRNFIPVMNHLFCRISKLCLQLRIHNYKVFSIL